MNSQRKLLLAGITAAAAIALSAVSLSIAVIAGLRPPVIDQLTADQSAEAVSYTRTLWIPPAICIVGSILALVQVLMQRPLFFSRNAFVRVPSTSSQAWVIWILAGVSLYFSLRGLITSLSAIQAIAPRPMTDSLAFSGLAFPFVAVGLLLFILSSVVFANWWMTDGSGNRAAAA